MSDKRIYKTGRCWNCKHAVEHYGWGRPYWIKALYCEHPKVGEVTEDAGDDDFFSYSYGEGGSFQVGRLFGCVHWEADERQG